MITISLDEAGVFDIGQKVDKNTSKTTFIGGFIYDDEGNAFEQENERKRIEAYYKAVFDDVNLNHKVNAVYPNALHCSGKPSDRAVKFIKEKINETLPEFIQKGTFKGKELILAETVSNNNGTMAMALQNAFGERNLNAKRQGHYEIGAVVKSAEGKLKLLDKNVGKFFRDGQASNLYFHMASEIFEHMLFHNPLKDEIKEVYLDIATRKAVVSEQYLEQYIEQGMDHPSAKGEGNSFVPLMTKDVCRTIIFEQLLEAKNKNISIAGFEVKPIQYEVKLQNKKKDTPFVPTQFVFGYLADSICSYLSWQIGEDDVVGLSKKAAELTGKDKNLIFSYDETDVFFEDAWKAFEDKDYYTALQNLYELKSIKSKESEYYSKCWVPFIENKIIDEVADNTCKNYVYSNAFAAALNKLKDSFMSNTVNQQEAFYIFKVFEKAAKGIEDGRFNYLINEVGVVAYCHMGAPKQASSYFKKCERYARSINIEDYIRTRNRYATSLCDGFDYFEALSAIYVTLELSAGLVKLSEEKLGKRRADQFGKTEYAKTLSLAGQCASFLRNEVAVSFFEDAKMIMAADDSNRKITQSYLLHYYIDIKDKGKYEEELRDYTDGKTSLKEQIKSIESLKEKATVNGRYALYLYIKGLYTFYSDDEIKKVWNKLILLEQAIPTKEKTGHPWQLIYKYYSLIALRLGDVEKTEQYKKSIELSCEENKESLVEAIKLVCLYDVTKAEGKDAKLRTFETQIVEYMNQYFPLFAKGEKIDCADDVMTLVDEKFGYMYR